MATWRERLEVCEAAVRAHLDPGERVLAVGRCEDVTERGGVEAGGHGGTFVMVTDRRLRWAPGANLGLEASLEVDDVTAVYERSQAHRWAIVLEHAPLARPHHVPAHRFLRFAWGNAVSTAPLTRTVLAFSRRDSQAALALRAEPPTSARPADAGHRHPHLRRLTGALNHMRVIRVWYTRIHSGFHIGSRRWEAV